MITVNMVTLGCPKNQVDSEIMLGLLDQAKYRIIDDVNQADVAVVNTCGFIQDAKQESINMILDIARLKEIGQLKFLVVTGCLAQRYHDQLKEEIPEIDAVLGTGNFNEIVEVIEEGMAGTEMGGIVEPKFEYDKDLPRVSTTPDYTAYVKIAEGCNNRCSYCIIPQLRGPLKSRTIEDIVEEVERLTANGVKEVIIVAQDTTVYGVDIYGEPRLVSLLEELVKIDDLKWVRLMYSYPDHLSDDLIDIMEKEDKICNYLDLPIQHASNKILDLMNRPTNREEVESLINRIKKKASDIAIRTSLIVGFPGETEEDFAQLMKFVKEARFDRLGVFTYSREEDTPADKLEGHLSEEIKEERRNKIMAIQRNIALEKNEAMIGKEIQVLVEELYSQEEEIVVGRTQWDAPEIDGLVYVHNSQAQIGDFINVKIVDAMEYDLVGEEIK